MEARRAPLLVGGGAAIVAIVAAVILVRRSPDAIVGEADARSPVASAVGGAATTPSAMLSAEAVASASASPSSEALAVSSGAAAGSAAPHAVNGPRVIGTPDAVAAGPDSAAGAATAEAGASRPSVVRIDEASDGKTLELAPGQQLVATLDANPTTGFDWAVVKAPPALGAPEMGYVAGGSAPGSSGKRIVTWTLKAGLPPGVHGVEMGYARSFEKGVAPFKTFRCKVSAPAR